MCIRTGKTRGTTLFHPYLAEQTSQAQPGPAAVTGVPGAAYSEKNSFPHTARGGLHILSAPLYTTQRLSAPEKHTLVPFIAVHIIVFQDLIVNNKIILEHNADNTYNRHIRNKKGVLTMKTVSTDKAPAAIGPYSQAQICGGLVFTSGQIPVDPATGEIASDVESQASQVFKNISELLKAAGSDIGKVVKTTVFIKDMNDFGKINDVYSRYFTEPFPARSCVEVARLPKDVLIECEAIAEL